MRRPASPALLMAMLGVISSSACQLNSGFLSESERSSLYDSSICGEDGSALAEWFVPRWRCPTSC